VTRCPAGLGPCLPVRTTSDELAEHLGRSIEALRESRGETLETVARRIPSMDPSYLSAIEGGRHAVTIVTAARIARALGVSLSDLVNDLPPAPGVTDPDT
jgi:transcriptional regulator with XRE-family HTH domain